MYHLGEEISHRCLGLGPKADNYDGEMFALANAAKNLADTLETFPSITLIRLFADNTPAIDSIYETNPHPAQSASIIFRKHIDAALTAHATLRITLNWSPGHAGIKGNERADFRQNRNHPPTHDQLDTQLGPARSQIAGYARVGPPLGQPAARNQAAPPHAYPPSTRPNKFICEFTGSRALFSRTMQVVTGHGFSGEYYSRFVPTEPTACPCGEADPQTREHILIDCPRHEHAQGALRAASSDLSMDFLFGTMKGLTAVANFLHRCSAFRKSPHDPG
ncbi:hypothetical protein HGRIS_009827 [Hohenbuehelia grisea]|uniref:RNase H type-1 domain-containing protein n=1 Tax=Hohenbuehelia grisea TaxID=104357 RepID=A0ABR3J2B8_9AGAR